MNISKELSSLDTSIFIDINKDFMNPFFDSLFPFLRLFTFIFWLFLVIYFWARKERELAAVLAIGIAAGAIFTYPLKFLIDRQRPYEQIDTARTLTPFEGDPSFPSGHTEMSFVAATIISHYHPRYSMYLYGFSLVIALSRIYVGVHFPLDVIGGAVIGVIIGKIVLRGNFSKSGKI